MSKKSDILYLFDRPAEPVYVPKGENKVAFNVPANYLVSAILLDSLEAHYIQRIYYILRILRLAWSFANVRRHVKI